MIFSNAQNKKNLQNAMMILLYTVLKYEKQLCCLQSCKDRVKYKNSIE